MIKRIVAILGALAILAGFTAVTLRFVHNNAGRGMTRAEFVSYINTSYGLTSQSDSQYSDVDADKWYAADFLTARGAGYIVTPPGNVAAPEAEVTRADAYDMIRNILVLLNKDDISGMADERLEALKSGSGGVSVSELKPIIDAIE